MLAERNLINQGYETFLPMLKVTTRKTSKFINSLKPFFPGYMFVCVKAGTEALLKIRNTVGVSRIVSFNGVPKPLPSHFVIELRKRFDKYGILINKNNFNIGDYVEVLTGPFTNFIASIEAIDSQKRIWLIMDLMGQNTRISARGEDLRPKS